MLAKRSSSSFGGIPDPDFASGATAFQTTSLNQQANSPTSPTSAPPGYASHRSRPSIPQKKTHVEEMFRLRKDLEDAIRVRDEAVEMRDMMAEDLLTAQEEVQEKEEELGKVSQEMWAWRDKAEKLTNQLREERARQSRIGTETMSATTREINARRAAEQMQLQMRQQIDQLTAALAEREAQLIEKTALASEVPASVRETHEIELQQKEDEWRSLVAEEQNLRYAAEAELRNAKDQYESQLKDAERLASSQIEAEKRRVQATEAALNEQMSRMEIDSTNQQQHEQQIAAYKMEIEEQRQRCNQFRKTSQRLTTQVKQVIDAKKDLERSDQEMRMRIDDMKSQIASLQAQARDYRMPGSFSEGPTRYS